MSKEKNTVIYRYAVSYLTSLLPSDYCIENLERYLVGEAKDVSTLKDIYRRFLISAQNYQSMPNVIQFWTREKELRKYLFDYDYQRVKDLDPYVLYKELKDVFSPSSNDSRRNSWYKWSCSAIDSARFISQFHDYDDFDSFVNQFRYNSAAKIALPLLISTRIRGMGFALVCDMLKEMGYVDYPKPDVHIIDICEALGLSSRNQYDCFETICQMAADNDVTPYRVDKILWLICSGRFYLDGMNIGRHKDQFIESARRILKEKELY